MISISRNNKQPLTKERIVQASFDYVEQFGIEALSMRKIAELLGVKAMSLYNHVQNKEDILDMLLDRVISKITVPDLQHDWKEAMRVRATTSCQVLLQHSWALHPIVSRKIMGPSMLTYFDRSLACLTNAGFNLVDADNALHALDSYTYGFVLIRSNFPLLESEYAEAAKDHIDLIPVKDYPALHELAQLVIKDQYSGVTSYEFGLAFILDGLERRLIIAKAGREQST